ncbi:MAG TPA: ribonuclease R [Chitinophagaceae bacterium]|nr:ribonuclease R [Chitinophagaceae bacterium]
MGRKNSKKRKKEKHTVQGQTAKGVLDITRSGMGFVAVENFPVDVIVRPGDFNTALHGDTVRVKIKEEKKGGKRMQGEITEVLRRKQTEFIGKMQVKEVRPDDPAAKGFGFFIAETDKPMPDIYIPKQNFNGAKDNDRVVVRMLEWDKDGKRPVGEVLSIMDEEDSNDMAMKEILLQNGFPLIFPDDAMEEAARIPDTIPAEEIKKRKDVREILTFTIDPVDAKDFDDAISYRLLKNGNYEIGVHIADVAYYVEEGTALDNAAYEKATSVYLPDRVNPMLPEHISNVLCSLRPDEDKLTFSAIFQINSKGVVKQHWLGKTVIHSDHRFTYEEVQEIIEKKEGIYSEEILILNNLAQRFRKQRFKNGAINFSSQEVRFKLDENKKPVGIVIKESKESHQLIEEFMLLANRTVAADLSKIKVKNKPIPFPYRVHDNPDEEKLLPFVAFARKFGYKFDPSSPDAIATSFNQMLVDVHGKPEQHVLEQLGIRTMAKAKYDTENIGHYGLGFENYCHFTSPIRRYPDVIVHRVLQQVIEENASIDKKMEEKCKHCSERERASMEAERAANKYKQVEYMKNFLGDEFEGVISGVASFGFWVETVAHKCEGLVSINSLVDFDDFRHVETDYCLVGQRSGRKFRMGDKVWIKVVAANLTKRQLDYEWVVASGLRDGKKKKHADTNDEVKNTSE